MQGRRQHHRRHEHDDPYADELHRKIPVRAQHDFSSIARRATDPDVAQSALQALPNRRQRLEETENSARRDRAGTNVKDVGATNLVRPHLQDRYRAWCQRTGNVIAEKFDQRNQQQVTQHSARTHDRRNARTDDVTNPDELGRNLRADRTALERCPEDFFGHVFPPLKRDIERLVEQADGKTREDDFRTWRGAESGRFSGTHLGLRLGRSHGAALGRGTSLEHGGARGALGIFEHAMLLHDEGTPQRDHHQDAEQPAHQGDDEHTRKFEVETENQNRRHRHADTERNRLTRRPRRLRDVILQNRRVAQPHLRQPAEHGQRDHRHRNRRTHRQTDFEHEVERRGAENHAEDRARDDGPSREFPHHRLRRDEGVDLKAAHGDRRRADFSPPFWPRRVTARAD